MTPFLPDDLKHDEGCRLHAYQDTRGIWTIGVGHAHVAPDTVWTQEQADAQLNLDILGAEVDLDRSVPWWRDLNDARQDVMVNLCFNMGWGDGRHGLSSFGHTLEVIRLELYSAAAEGLLASKWAGQVHGRATRLAQQLKTGVRVAP